MQTNREVAELIAKFRTPPGMSWANLANDIETALNSRAPAWREAGARRSLTIRVGVGLIARIDEECRRRKARSREATIRLLLDEALSMPLSAEQSCPGHVASEHDTKVCGLCGTHIDGLRPLDDGECDGAVT